MIDRSTGYVRTLGWWAIVYAVFVTPLDFSTIELNDGSAELLKWLARLPAWYLPVVLLLPRWSRLPELLRRPPISWLLAWGGLAAASVLWALLPTQALTVGLALAGLILLSAWYVHTEGWYPFAMAVSVGLTAFIIAGLAWDLANGTLVNGVLEGRSIGISASPTTLGILASYNVVVTAGLLHWHHGTLRGGKLLWIAPAVSTLALIFAETRTAMAATAIGVIYGGLRRLPPLYRWLVLLGLGALVVAALGITVAFSDPTSLGERGDPTSVAGRTSIWPIAFDLFTQQPILGYGFGANVELFVEAARSGRLTFLAGTSHSIVLSSLLSGGVVGFLLLATAVASAARHRRRVDAWIFAPVIVVMIGGLTEAMVHRPEVGTILLAGSMTAIARVPIRATPTTPDQPPFQPAPPRPTRSILDHLPARSPEPIVRRVPDR